MQALNVITGVSNSDGLSSNSHCCMLCAGINAQLPIVTLKRVEDLRWTVMRGEYIDSHADQGATAADAGSSAAAVLWAVDSVQRRASTLPAMQMSQIERQHKTPVGVLRGVVVRSPNSILAELWFIEGMVVEESDEQPGQSPQSAVQERSKEASDEEPSQDEQPAQEERARQSSRQSSRRRRSGGGQQDSQATASSADARRTRPPLMSVLLAEGSPQPVLVGHVDLDLQYYPGASARAGLLEITREDICVRLCEVKKVQDAFGPLDGLAPSSAEGAAQGLATAIFVAEETNAKRAARQGEHIRVSFSVCFYSHLLEQCTC